MGDTRVLKDLRSVGPATVRDFNKMGITNVSQLVDKDAVKLYHKLEKITGIRQDPCVEDVFRCAIEQARNPRLSKQKSDWFYWSKIRKQRTTNKK